MILIWLQAHVICWACLSMGLLNIHLRDLGVMAHHVQRTVTEQGLQGKYVAARTQIGDGECVAKFMWINSFDLGPVSQPVDQHAQAVLVEGFVGMADEEGGANIVPVFTACQIAPDGFPSDFPHIDGAAFASLGTASQSMPDSDLAGFQVHIVDGQGAKFTRPQSGIQECEHNRLVAVAGRPAHNKLFAFLGLRFPGVNAGLHDLFNIFLREGFDRVLLEFRCGDFDRWVGIFELDMQPAEEGPEGHPHVADRFRRQWFGAAVETHRFIFGAQPGQVASEVGRLDVRNIPVADMFQPMVQCELIGGNRALA